MTTSFKDLKQSLTWHSLKTIPFTWSVLWVWIRMTHAKLKDVVLDKDQVKVVLQGSKYELSYTKGSKNNHVKGSLGLIFAPRKVLGHF